MKKSNTQNASSKRKGLRSRHKTNLSPVDDNVEYSQALVEYTPVPLNFEAPQTASSGDFADYPSRNLRGNASKRKAAEESKGQNSRKKARTNDKEKVNNHEKAESSKSRKGKTTVPRKNQTPSRSERITRSKTRNVKRREAEKFSKHTTKEQTDDESLLRKSSKKNTKNNKCKKRIEKKTSRRHVTEVANVGSPVKRKGKLKTKIRISPKIFSDIVESLSEPQKDWVRSAGFGSLLEFKLKELPHWLGYNVLISFNHDTISLNLSSGCIPITDEDVNEVLGLPIGGQEIASEDYCPVSEMMQPWRNQFEGILHHKITPTNVCEKIKQSSEVSTMFKLNFLLLVVNCFIESHANPYVNQRILAFFKNVDNCSEFNWCAFLIQSLKRNQKSWLENPDEKFYVGPLVFLILFYVDRVIYKGERVVERRTPTFLGWTDFHLRRRQAEEMYGNKFGKGTIENSVRENRSMHGSTNSSNVNSNYNKCLSKVKKVAADLEFAKHRYDDEFGNMKRLFPGDSRLTEIEQRIADLFKEWQNHEEVDLGMNETNEEQVDIAGNKGTPNECGGIQEGMHVERDDDTSPVIGAVSTEEGQNYQPFDKVHIELVDVPPETDEVVIEEMHVDRYDDNEGVNNVNNEDIDAVTTGTQLSTQFFEQVDAIVLSASKESDQKKKTDNFGKSKLKDFGAETPSFSIGLSQKSPSKFADISNAELVDIGQQYVAQIQQEAIMKPADETASAETPQTHTINQDQDIIEGHVTIGELGNPNLMMKKRKVKPGTSLRSPWVQRVTEITSHRNYIESAIWNWLIHEGEDNNADSGDLSLDVLFKFRGREYFGDIFKSLNDREEVEASVVSVWTYILNHKEQIRSEASPLRFFCTAETTLWCLHKDDEPNNEARYLRFASKMDELLILYPEVKFEDIDMIFFPINAFGHFYIVCYGLKKLYWEIIDNSSVCPSFRKKYQQRPEGLHRNFSRYLEAKKHPKVKEIRKLKPVRLQMDWQTIENHQDCGIFVMRHMETYMGRGGSGWKSGLSIESDKQRRQLIRLRTLYCAQMLTSEINEMGESNLERATSYYNEHGGKKIDHMDA